MKKVKLKLSTYNVEMPILGIIFPLVKVLCNSYINIASLFSI